MAPQELYQYTILLTHCLFAFEVQVTAVTASGVTENNTAIDKQIRLVAKHNLIKFDIFLIFKFTIIIDKLYHNTLKSSSLSYLALLADF